MSQSGLARPCLQAARGPCPLAWRADPPAPGPPRPRLQISPIEAPPARPSPI